MNAKKHIVNMYTHRTIPIPILREGPDEDQKLFECWFCSRAIKLLNSYNQSRQLKESARSNNQINLRSHITPVLPAHFIKRL